MIEDNTSLFINIGTTPEYVAEELVKRGHIKEIDTLITDQMPSDN